MRDNFWKWLIAKHPKGKILSRWLFVCRVILYPIDTFYWIYGNKYGYNPCYDEWIIHGIRYSNETLLTLAAAQGEIYRITRVGECVTLERVDTCPECGELLVHANIGDGTIDTYCEECGWRQKE